MSTDIQSKCLKNFILLVAIFWSCFQLWIASPLPYFLADFGINLVISDSQSRIIHLALALLLCFSSERYAPSKWKNIFYILGIFGFVAVIHNFVFFEQIALNAGIVSSFQIIVSIVGILILMVATQQSIGFPIVVIGSIFIFYTMFGNHLPMIISHKGHDLGQVAYQQWLSSEGIFGVALGVSSDFIFLFVLFGGFLEASGASNFFIKLAFAWLGKLKNGAAKATIIGSALMGIMSGSSVATTITIGTMTIPLMKKAGFSGEKAGGIQIAAGVNGQITPPIMGAAAFLMAEFLSIPYSDIIKYALLPSIVIYFSLFYSVHLERTESLFEKKEYQFWNSFKHFLQVMSVFAMAFVICGLCIAGFYFLMQGFSLGANAHFPGLKSLFGGSIIGAILFLILSYLVVIYLQFKFIYADINKIHEHNEKIDDLREYIDNANPLNVLLGGFHYLIPIFILLWLLTIERMSSASSVFWSTVAVLVIIFTHNNLLYILHKQANAKYLFEEFKEDIGFVIAAMKSSSKSMVGIALATAVSGIIIGSISQTGISQAFVDILETVARDNILIILITTSIICIILGMGMPTTACYMIVSSLMVPVIFEITQDKGMNVAPVALHFFVFYFGLMADITPPVGLASYAAAAISGANPIKTAIYGLQYNKNVLLLPFIFVYNNDLLFYKITVGKMVFTTICALLGSMAFVSSMKGYFLTKNKFYETAALLIIGISFFNPNLMVNLLQKPYQKINFEKLQENFANFNEDKKTKFILINESGSEKIFYYDIKNQSKHLQQSIEKSIQIDFIIKNNLLIMQKIHNHNINNVKIIDLFKNGYQIQSIEAPVQQFDKRFILIGNLVVLLFIILNQHLRKINEKDDLTQETVKT